MLQYARHRGGGVFLVSTFRGGVVSALVVRRVPDVLMLTGLATALGVTGCRLGRESSRS